MNNAGSPSAPAQATPTLESKTTSSLSYAELKERNKIIKRAEKAVENAEQLVTKLEDQIQILETKLATPEGANDPSLFTQYGNLKQQLSDAEEKWTEASMELEELTNEQ